MPYYLYIAKNSQKQLYIGQTSNLKRRIKRHNSKNGGKYTSDYFGDFKIVYYEAYTTRKEAMRRELQIKKWSRAKKEALIQGDLKRLKR